MATMKIGFSLSYCVKDIIDGKVREDEVLLLIAGTLTPTEEDWQHVMELYSESYWDGHGAEGMAIANRLRSKMIEFRKYPHDHIWFPLHTGWWADVDPNN